MPRKMARQTLEPHAGACCAGSRPYLGSGLLGSPENRYNLPHFRVHPGNPGLHSKRDDAMGTRVAAMPSGPGERYDFFLSRRGSVANVAREVCDVLTEKGYKVIIQDYDKIGRAHV